jgi:hypothetical protein
MYLDCDLEGELIGRDGIFLGKGRIDCALLDLGYRKYVPMPVSNLYE